MKYFRVKKVYSLCSFNRLNKIIAESSRNSLDGHISKTDSNCWGYSRCSRRTYYWSEGASITKLIQKANISHSRISKILTNLVSQGLLEQVDSKRACKYKISMSGKEFLKEFKRFSEFTDNFGLTI